MNKQIIAGQLVQFGLDEIEATIYLNLLESGAKTPLEISRETNVNRTKIYRYIERLKQKKLIEETNIGRGMKLAATRPESLQLIIFDREQQVARQKTLLPDVLKELSVLPTALQNTFEIKHYHGEEGLKQMMWNQLSAKKEILLYGYQTRNEIVGASFADKVREEQVRRKITIYELEEEIDPGNFTNAFTYTKVLHWEKYYIPRYVDPTVITIRQCTAIFNNTISIMNWLGGQKVGVEIVNAQYAQMQRQLFWSVWEKIAVTPRHHTLKRYKQ